MNRVRDWIGKRMLSFAVEHVMSPRTGARFEVTLYRGAGLVIPDRVRERAGMERGPGQ